MSTIINFLRSVIDAIIRFFETVKEFFIYLWDIIENLPAYIIDGLVTIWEWFLSLGPWFFSLIYSGFVSLFPQDTQEIINTNISETVSPYYNLINVWVPLDLAQSLILCYFTFVAVYIVVAWIIKLIPGEG